MDEAKCESGVGRPRCEVAKQAILDAVWRLLGQMPLKSLSIEAIAREAGVGKATIYRWWPSKAAVAMDAFLHNYIPSISISTRGGALQCLERQMTAVAKAYTGDVARVAADLIAEGQSDPAVLKIFNEQFVQPRRALAKLVIESGIAAGEIEPTINPDVALDIVFGPIYFRLLVRHAPIDEAFIKELPRTVLRALMPRKQNEAAAV